jgi:hypothetical protein
MRNRHPNDPRDVLGTGGVGRQGCPTLWITNSRFKKGMIWAVCQARLSQGLRPLLSLSAVGFLPRRLLRWRVSPQYVLELVARLRTDPIARLDEGCEPSVNSLRAGG